MSTGAIIAIVVVAIIILVLLLVLLPRMRKQAAERKAEQERRERERKLEAERQEQAQLHRSQADDQRHKAELAEAEAKRSRAEADINAKRAEMHESGLADDQLPSGDASRASVNGRAEDPDLRPGDDRDADVEREGRPRGGRSEGGYDSSHLREDREFDRDRDQDWHRPDGVRDLGGGGRAHEPVDESRGQTGARESGPDSEYERGLQDGERARDQEQR